MNGSLWDKTEDTIIYQGLQTKQPKWNKVNKCAGMVPIAQKSGLHWITLPCRKKIYTCAIFCDTIMRISPRAKLYAGFSYTVMNVPKDMFAYIQGVSP